MIDTYMGKQIGIGGAPSRATTFPEDSKGRKSRPVASGVLDYFPDALVAVSEVSWHGNEQHNPGKPLHWDRSKSGDEADCLIRHFLQRGTRDSDGLRHSAKMAWRALAFLQKEIEAEPGSPIESICEKCNKYPCGCSIPGKGDCSCIRGTEICSCGDCPSPSAKEITVPVTHYVGPKENKGLPCGCGDMDCIPCHTSAPVTHDINAD